MSESNSNNDFSDDLLDDLAQLDKATNNLVEDVSTLKKAQKTDNKSSVNNIDATTIALETAKILQISAQNNQYATDAIIKLSFEQKQHNIELSKSNHGWKLGVNKATKNIENSKKTITTMLIVSIIFSLVAVGVIGFLYYSINNKNAAMQENILDIISTRLEMSNKEQTIKIAKITSLIENISINKNLPIEQGIKQDAIIKTEQKTIATIGNDEIKQQLLEFGKQLNQQQKRQQTTIETLLIQINEQIKLSKTQIAPKVITPVKVTAMGLTESQLKRLNHIHSMVNQQSKMLSSIQNKFNQQVVKEDNNKSLIKIAEILTDLTQQITLLQQQQAITSGKLQQLKIATEKITATPQRYSFPPRN